LKDVVVRAKLELEVALVVGGDVDDDRNEGTLEVILSFFISFKTRTAICSLIKRTFDKIIFCCYG
jgi:hypothetical protein